MREWIDEKDFNFKKELINLTDKCVKEGGNQNVSHFHANCCYLLQECFDKMRARLMKFHGHDHYPPHEAKLF